ncbi:hypothetical protein ECZC04_53940 [Escherichia coli]|nr:hypothetical protein ECZC04_53940 [Escherichia coli]
MLGGADNPNGELPSYITGANNDSPPRQGDARKRHNQENNKTDNNQGSSNQSQNRRKRE